MPLIRKRVFAAPRLEMPSDLKDKIGKALRNGILQNIAKQVQADGSPIKKNSRGYRDYKSRSGLTWRGQVLSLVSSEHRFTRPELWPFSWSGGRITIEPSGAEDTAKISIEVQRKGYVGWFAPRADVIEAVKQLVRDWIRKAIERAARSASPG